MNDIIESGVESAVSGLLLALISLIVTHIGVVLLVALIAIVLFMLIRLYIKRRNIVQRLSRIKGLQQETTARLNEVLVSDTFKELKLGLTQGETARVMEGLERSAYTLRQQAEQLGDRLRTYQVRLFSLDDEVDKLEFETEDLWQRVDLYIRDLSGIQREAKGATQHVQHLERRLKEASNAIVQFCGETGYSLDQLMDERGQVEERFSHADQLAAFDTVNAKVELKKVEHLVGKLEGRIEDVRKNITIRDKILSRLNQQKEQLLHRIEGQKHNKLVAELAAIFQMIDPIMKKLDQSLGKGQDIDMRAAAADIELILQEAAAWVEKKAPLSGTVSEENS